jgi:hypothetical protein
MKRLLVAILTLAFVASMSSTALAAVNNKAGLPTATFNGATVSVTGGDFSGLGNIPAFATLNVTGTTTYTCQNPGGSTKVPGQNPVPAQGGTSGAVQLPTNKNGRATIGTLTASVTAPSTTPSAQTVGCGGGGSTSWQVIDPVVTATAATLTITHGNPGPTIFCAKYVLGGSATGTPC